MESQTTFAKLWGHLRNFTIKANQTYTFKIQNLYPVSIFNGKKSLYLTELGPMGGKNTFMAITFFVAAGCFFLFILIFIVCYCAKIRNKDIYSTSELEW